MEETLIHTQNLQDFLQLPIQLRLETWERIPIPQHTLQRKHPQM
ncbi:hypothetical protein scyTo_0023354, partial [Scyliorhinus torazame]|nr:hypothetical protein [Scyliorhinus torazame]